MTTLEAAEEVLRRAGRPLHIQDITDRMLESGLWQTQSKMPRSSVSDCIVEDIANKGRLSRFRRAGPGVYGLNKPDSSGPTGELIGQPRETPEPTLSYTDAAEQILRQNDGQEPLHYREIARRIIDRGLVATNSVNPPLTLTASIGGEIERREESNRPQRFVRLGGGLIALAPTVPKSDPTPLNNAGPDTESELARGHSTSREPIQMTARDAAAEVLRRAGTPLHIANLTDRALELGSWNTDAQKPQITLTAAITGEINSQGEESRFRRVGIGVYDLKDRGVPTQTPKPSAPEAPVPKLSFIDAAELVLRQNGGQEPLHYREITRRILELGLVETRAVDPPHALNGVISGEIERRRNANRPQRFVRLGGGLIALAPNVPKSDPTPLDNEGSDTESELAPDNPTTRDPIQMTAVDAAAEVLRRAGTPLHIANLTDRALELGSWNTDTQKPQITLTSAITGEINSKGEQSRFRRVGIGVYDLNDRSAPTQTPKLSAPAPEVPKPKLSFTDAAELVLRQSDGQEPLHYREITRRILELGLVETNAVNPPLALSGIIGGEIRRRREANRPQRFVRLGGGLIALADFAPAGNRNPLNEEGLETARELAPGQSTTRNRVPMIAVDAAAEALREAGEPLHVRSITNRIIERGLWTTQGKTPWSTVNSLIVAEISRKGEESRFLRIKPSVYDLRKSSIRVGPSELNAADTRIPKQEASLTDAAERILRRSAGREPLHSREIARRMLDLGLVATKAVTPAYTLSAAINDEVRQRRDAHQPQRFVRLGRGLIGLADAEPEGVRNAIVAENKRVRDDLKKLLRSIDPGKFEHFVRELFSALGAERVEVTQRSGDGGVDVRGTLLVGGAIAVKIGAQVKRWKHIVDSPVVNETRGSLGLHDVGLVVTTGRFSHEARQAARIEDRKPITLIDGDALVDLMVEHEIWVKQQHNLLTLATPSPD